MIPARTILGFVAVVLLLVGLSSTSWKRVRIQVRIGTMTARATGGYGLRRVRGCAKILKSEHCVSESLDRSVADLERMQRSDKLMHQAARMFLPKRRRPAVRRQPTGKMKPGAAPAAKAPKTPPVPDLRTYFKTSATVGKRSLDRLWSARAYGAAIWVLGLLLVVVLFATGVASVLRVQYVPRWARLVATATPALLALPLVYLSVRFLATVGESESVFAGLPLLSYLGPVEIESHNGWAVYVFAAGVATAVLSGLMCWRWRGVPEPPTRRARPGAHSRLADHRTGARRGAKEVAGLLMSAGDEESEQLDALGAYADFVERLPETILSAYAERKAIDLARGLGESRLEVLACERFVMGHPGHPDTPTLARAGAKLCADILGDADRAEVLRKAGG